MKEECIDVFPDVEESYRNMSSDNTKISVQSQPAHKYSNTELSMSEFQL